MDNLETILNENVHFNQSLVLSHDSFKAHIRQSVPTHNSQNSCSVSNLKNYKAFKNSNKLIFAGIILVKTRNSGISNFYTLIRTIFQT